MKKQSMPGANVCWRAVTSRNRAYDGAFVFAVRSTGIFCRPSCPARRPARRRVMFFNSPEAAARLGFRPCLRCRPWSNSADEVRDQAKRWTLAACRHIEEHLDEMVSLTGLASELGASRFQLLRAFKKTTGVSPREYADQRRMNALKTGLRAGQAVTRALYEAGFGSSSRLYERAPAQLGMTPSSYRKGGEGMEVDYAIVRCSLGRADGDHGEPCWLLVGATRRGVCAVQMGNSEDELKRGLAKEFSQAALNGGNKLLARWTRAIVRHIERGRPLPEIPLDVQATAFQRRVWQELSRIPYGETRSYKQIAQSVGKPRAVRAVGHACATNSVALIVPCHRAIRSDGKLGGYRWGLDRKEVILRRERQLANPRLRDILRTTMTRQAQNPPTKI